MRDGCVRKISITISVFKKSNCSGTTEYIYFKGLYVFFFINSPCCRVHNISASNLSNFFESSANFRIASADFSTAHASILNAHRKAFSSLKYDTFVRSAAWAIHKSMISKFASKRENMQKLTTLTRQTLLKISLLFLKQLQHRR
jgi:hypothetical protein